MIGTIFRNVDGITLLFDFVTDLGSLDGYLDVSNYGKLEGLLLGGSLGSTDGKLTVSNEDIKLRLFCVKVIGTILGNVYGITLGLNVGTYPGSLHGSFDGSDDGNLEGLLLGDSLGSTDGKVIRSDEGTTRAGLTWSGVNVMVMGWMFGGFG